MSKIKFEDKIDVINEQIDKQRSSWRLSSVNHVGWEDVRQIILIHIHKKWHIWDQTKPIEPWLYRLVSNQINNLLRNFYYSFTRPCLGVSGKACAANEGGDLCAITPSRRQCNECPLYAKWERTKKRAHDVKLPVNIEDNEHFVTNESSNFIDYANKIDEVHQHMSQQLPANQYRIYKMLYIDHASDEEVVKKMGYTSSTAEGRKRARYKQLEIYKRSFVEIARSIIEKNSILND